MKQTSLSVCLNYESKSWVWLDFIGKICHKSLYQTLVCVSCLLDRECTTPYIGFISWRPFYTKVTGTFLFSIVKTSYYIRNECQSKGFGLIIMIYVTYLYLIIKWQPELCRVGVLGKVQDVGWAPLSPFAFYLENVSENLCFFKVYVTVTWFCIKSSSADYSSIFFLFL